MTLPFELITEEDVKLQPNIKVIGVGGGGGNAVAHMIRRGLRGVEFIVANTDYKVLSLNPAPVKIQLGKKLTKGLGAGGKPEVGRSAAEESEKEIRDALKDADMVFLAAGMGGGTGTGATPVIASICKEMGILTVAVVTKPFPYEFGHRMKIAEDGIEELKRYVDTLIVIPNEKLLTYGAPKEPIINMFRKADDVLYYAVKGISDLITSPGYINLDFADVKTVMTEYGGIAHIGFGEGIGEDRAQIACENAILNPLLEVSSITGAKGLLLNVSVHPETLTVEEAKIVFDRVTKELDVGAKVFLGISFDESLEDRLHITLVATGLEIAKSTSEQSSEKVLKFRKKDQSSVLGNYRELIDERFLDIPTILRKSAD